MSLESGGVSAQALESSKRMEADSLRRIGEDVMLAMLECADHEKMGGATQYWPTVRKAMRVSAQSSRTWGEWLEGVRATLKIEQLRSDPASLICSAGESIAARDGWPQLRQLILDETTLFEVKIRTRRDERKQLSGRTYALKQVGEVVDDE